MVSGADGSIVDRTSASIEDLSPVGAAQSVMAVPYYRDDSCFDDGTGSDPGVELFPRSPDRERAATAPDGSKRRCWGKLPGDPAVPGGDTHFWQGSIATHGIHILFIADSDNARLTIPTSEVVAETRMVMLPGSRGGSVGEQYGRAFEKPLAGTALPAVLLAPAPGEQPEQAPAPSRQPSQAATDSPSKGSSQSYATVGAQQEAERKAQAKAKAKAKHKTGAKAKAKAKRKARAKAMTRACRKARAKARTPRARAKARRLCRQARRARARV
jgi:hypothetical protein